MASTVDSSGQQSRKPDVLLASYKATKDEIARRSALQWAIIAGYAFLLYSAFAAVLKPHLYLLEAVSWPFVAWSGSLVALLFHCREQMEIMRLSHIVSELIDKQLQNLGYGGLLFERTGHKDVPEPKLGYDRKRAECYEKAFKFAVFLVAPLSLTILTLVQGIRDYSSWLMPLLLLAISLFVDVSIFAFAIGYLLGQDRSELSLNSKSGN